MPRVQCSGSELVWQIADGYDVVTLQAYARRFLRGLGFSKFGSAGVLIAASEMATNSLKYAGGGTLSISGQSAPEAGVRVEACDEGPGIVGLSRALEDHISESRNLLEDEETRRHRRGLGTGLGAIQRLMDRVEIHSQPGLGTRLVAFKRRL